jgi:hypothetical protein
MKEFDFDELDRAVNSLMADVKQPTPTSSASSENESPVSTPVVPVTPPTSDAPVTSPVPEPPTSPQDPTPVSTPVTLPVSTPAPSPAAVTTPVVPAPTPRPSVSSVVPQRSGRFMDVVHPSSDMKTSAPTLRPSASLREGASVQPSSSVSPSASMTPQPVIDVVAPQQAVVPAPSPVETKEEEPQVEQPKEQTSEPTNEPWGASPFLPDAQVEKRPLGGANQPPQGPPAGLSEAIAAELSKELPDQETSTSPTVKDEISSPDPEPSVAPVSTSAPEKEEREPDTEPVPKDDLQLPVAPEKEVAPMPAELDTNLVAIESGQAAANVTSSSPSPAAMLTTSSIPQQYDEQPTSGDTSHTPIYDNEANHQPLSHPAKKKSGWLMVVFIIGILILGGGLGAAAYFVGLI